MNTLIKQLGTSADDFLPMVRPRLREPQFIAWAEWHGWDLAAEESPRLIARQALLNAAVREICPGLPFHETPLDFMPLPSRALSVIQEAERHSQSFNFWGDLYAVLIPQHARRRVGQFWTHEPIADWMIAWLLQSRPASIFDVGCGAGNFLLKAAQRLQGDEARGRLRGLDRSPLLLNLALAAFASRGLPLPELVPQDYLQASLPSDVDAVVCNPPYTRHHFIAPEMKDHLQRFFATRFDEAISRKATMAFYFLMKIIAEMPEGAPGAIIVPMEVLDARYGAAAKRTLCEQTALTAIVHFSQEMNAFHKVDVGAAILLFRKGRCADNMVRHITLKSLPTTDDLLACLDCRDSVDLPFGSLAVEAQRDLVEIPKWCSIADSAPKTATWENAGIVVPLKALAKVVRGIATGANQFFALPTLQVERLGLGPYVVRTVQRSRDIQDILLDEAVWETLSHKGKPVWLLYLNDEALASRPEIAAYLAEGEKYGYHRRSLVQTRKHWYFTEQREVPPIFFTILTRGNPRFILNKAGVRPLNMFSLVYPNSHVVRADCAKPLWALLNSTFSLSRLHSVSRTYGGKTLKVEPRELDNLPVINPLVLPDSIKKEIEKRIEDFERSRERPFFVAGIDAIVEEVLKLATASQLLRSPLPQQLRLFGT
jgi:SAM-dependent methyltransferase